ncbi:ammonium transporter [Botrimarina mediterranea]|uniref:Ammonium transporter n=1 Tax=Botrimarina mediterranea TaxID=2528022 RepID=A0A518K9B8_9BACT|nr:ammonium transporter [Botrimarina mediterranea]QDV74386.1 Ammonium transporter NrgA [Botrimarina mediterranea]
MTLALERRGWAVMLLALLAALAGPAGYAIAQEEAEAPAATEEAVEAPAEEEAVAEEPVEEEATTEEAPEEEAVDLGIGYAFDNAVLFFCAVLVFFMQAGFAMVEAGFNSSKNAVNIMFKNAMDICVGVLLFFAVGFGLMYPLGYENNAEAAEHLDTAPGFFSFGNLGLSGYSSGFSVEVDWLFQAVFAATAATIVSGAVAGRMKVSGYLIYSAILTGLVYPVSGFWKWGGGWLTRFGDYDSTANEFAMAFQDFAGSAVVHGLGGFAGLAGAIVLGPRIGRFVETKSIPMPGHNIPLAGLGVFILWFGWYGFNPGSQLAFTSTDDINATMHCAITTTLAAGAGGIVATVLSWLMFGKPDLSMGLNGILAGLVSITACCDCMTDWWSIVVGAIGGVLVIFGIIMLDKLKIDDPVGAWPVHGLCGIWGCLAIGIIPNDYLRDGATSFAIQATGALSICAWGFGTMFILFSVLKAVGLLRVSPEEEQQGLDISEHGMAAYTH